MTDTETTTAILRALEQRHNNGGNGLTPAWVFATELSLCTGFSSFHQMLLPHERDAYVDAGISTFFLPGRIDAYALHTWPTKKMLRLAYEVKVSRSDLLRELKHPEKRAGALAVSNQFYLVVAEGVKCLTSELDDEVGLIRWSRAGGLRTVKEPPYRKIPDPTVNFMMSLARTVQKQATFIKDMSDSA